MLDEDNRYKQLGDFLKTRRAKILPSEVGFLVTGKRRTPGLRREEVAQLAGGGLLGTHGWNKGGKYMSLHKWLRA